MKNCYQKRKKNKVTNKKTISNTIIHQNYVTCNNPSEPSDQQPSTVMKKGMYQQPVPVLEEEYQSAID